MSQTSPTTASKLAPPAPKQVCYRVRSWRQYERGLVERGRMTLWVHDRVLQQWFAPKVPGRRGAPRLYSDTLILCLWALKARYHLTHRGAEGLMKSLLWMLGVYRPVPDHTTLSRRGRHLPVPLARPASAHPIHVLIDSTGIKVLGASAWREWQRYIPGAPRDFRKLHLAFDADTQEIVAVEVTDKYDHDKDQVAALLAQIVDPIRRVTADGNYDFDSSRDAIRAYGAQDLIPPRANAVIQPANPRPERDRAIQLIETLGSKAAWKQQVGYHRRSLAETGMYRLKGQFGERMTSREKERQITEMHVWAWVLNQLTRLGMPVSRPVSATQNTRTAAGSVRTFFVTDLCTNTRSCQSGKWSASSRRCIFTENLALSVKVTAMNTTFVIFSGMAGTGKTTLARLLCQRRHIPLISFDHFVDYSWPRRLLDVEVLTDEEFWNILFSTVDLQLSLGLSVVMDAVFAGIGRDIAQQMAVRRKARFCAIHTFCSNETLWQERVITRERTALSNETPAKWEGIMAERDNFRAWNPDQALFIDAIHSVETNLAHILAYLDSAQ